MWKQWWPYKALAFLAVLLLAGANGLLELNTVADYTGSPDLEFTHGIRASVFALVAASFLFITLLPKDDTEPDVAIVSAGHALSVVTAFSAGLFWLLDETDGNFGPYVLVLLLVAGFLAAILVGMFLFQLCTDWVRRKRGVKEDHNASPSDTPDAKILRGPLMARQPR